MSTCLLWERYHSCVLWLVDNCCLLLHIPQPNTINYIHSCSTTPSLALHVSPWWVDLQTMSSVLSKLNHISLDRALQPVDSEHRFRLSHPSNTVPTGQHQTWRHGIDVFIAPVVMDMGACAVWDKTGVIKPLDSTDMKNPILSNQSP